MKFKTLFTGQHKDLLSDNEADYNHPFENFPGNRLDSVLKNCLSLNDRYFDGITHVLVQGDTTSVLGLAITAMHRGLKIIHLEAGLRTYDKQNPFPEENNRRLISAIADIHLCPTIQSQSNLIREGIDENDTYLVGNTGLDEILKKIIPLRDTSEPKEILITLHRRENHEKMDEWFTAINDLAKDYPQYNFVVPLHPNPMVQKHKDLLTDVVIVEPMSHFQLLNFISRSRLVITDSGGIQEECSFLRKKVLVCRKITERPESLGLTSWPVMTPNDLKNLFRKHSSSYFVPPDTYCPYGDGHASEKICDIFQGWCNFEKGL
jgi:UDP-N-acetylglucosamine 2-epimerase (non-hydrolysing)